MLGLVECIDMSVVNQGIKQSYLHLLEILLFYIVSNKAQLKTKVFICNLQ